MEKNKSNNNSVNYSEIGNSDRVSLGSQVGMTQASDGLHPATGSGIIENGHTIDETIENEDENRRKTSKKKWSKEENKEIWRCYSKSNPSLRGYRKRMLNI